MERDGSMKTQMQVAAESVLIRAYIGDYLNAHQVSDDALKAEYEKIKAGLGDKEYKARHILVEKKEDAESIIKQLQSGGKFDELAKANSKDTGSKENGGDLDWAAPANFVPEFSNAMVALKKGQMTDAPVRSKRRSTSTAGRRSFAQFSLTPQAAIFRSALRSKSICPINARRCWRASIAWC